ncbi:MAG: hypothetical protein ACTSO9_14545 [Candidatus Helarchaeota archaeon]
MVSANEKPSIDDVNRPQPIGLAAPPSCFQDGHTFRKTDMDCILCDYFNDCKKAKYA